jgi:hypothetical protein
MQFFEVFYKTCPRDSLCLDIVVPNDETYALQVPYDITRPEGLVYDLISSLRILFSNCHCNILFLECLLERNICFYRVDFCLMQILIPNSVFLKEYCKVSRSSD